MIPLSPSGVYTLSNAHFGKMRHGMDARHHFSVSSLNASYT